MKMSQQHVESKLKHSMGSVVEAESQILCAKSLSNINLNQANIYLQGNSILIFKIVESVGILNNLSGLLLCRGQSWSF